MGMAKLSGVRSCSSSSSKKKGGSSSGIVKLKYFVVEKLLQKRLKSSSSCYQEEGSSTYYVPEDVKEGHFAVIAEGAGNGKEECLEEPKRFVLPLSCLTNPTFVRLLEEAAEEYGFDHEGALTIPCRPSHLQRILLQQNLLHFLQ